MKYLLIGAGAAFIGMLPLPIEAYNLIRWIVAGISAFGAYEFSKKQNKDKFNAAIFAVIALIYNPILPFYLGRSLWVIIDAVTGAYMIWISLKFGSTNDNRPSSPLEESAARVDTRIEKLEKKADGFVKQLLISSIFLLIFIVAVSFIMKQ